MRADRLALAAVALVACAREVAVDAPRPIAVQPGRGYAGRAVALRITGERFWVAGVQRADGSARVDAGYRAWLGGVPLDDVRWVDEHTLLATAPAALPPGVHALDVASPSGATGRLESAFEAVAGDPPALSASLSAPAVVRLGATVAVGLDVHNAGGQTAMAFTPGVPAVGGTGEALDTGAAPGPQDIPPGETRSFGWTFATTGAGDVTFAVGGGAQDPVTGGAVTVEPATATVTIAAPSAISATAAAVPARVSTGQVFTASLLVSNAGQGGAMVTPALAPPGASVEVVASPGAAIVPAGAIDQPFTWVLRAGVPGIATFAMSVAGADLADPTWPVSASATAGPTEVQAPASLAATGVPPPAAVSVGQTFSFGLSVEDTGGASASLTPSLDAVGTGITILSAPAPATLAAGETRTFTWTATGTAATARTFTVRVAGIDGNDASRALSASATVGPVVVQAPASLTSTAAAPPQVSVGQTFDVTLAVSDAGEAGADVAPSIDPPGSAVEVVAGPSAASIPGGGAHAFTWTIHAVAPGTATFTLHASGTDANDPTRTVSTSATAAPSTTVQSAASLSAVASALPERISVGQEVPLTLTVTNGGQAAANVAPSISLPAALSVVAAPGAGTVPGAGSVPFTWTLRGVVSGSGTATARVDGTDANDASRPVSAAATSGPVAVQTRPVLTASAPPLPPTVTVGQTFPLVLRVSNAGQASAAVAPSLDLGAVPLAVVSAPVAATIPGGAVDQEFTWTLQATGPGTIAALSPRVDGADANDPGWPVSAAAVAGPVEVQASASLGISIAASPDPVNRAQTIAVAMTVTNGGQATATGVSPAALSASAALSTPLSGPAPPQGVTLAAGASQTFTWTCGAAAAGSLAFTGRAAGTDGNSGAPVQSAEVTSAAIQVQEPAALSLEITSAPARVDEGQRFAVSVRAANGGQAGAQGVAVGISVPGAAAEAAPGPVALVAGGADATFTRWFVAGAAGTTSVEAALTAGTDANDGSVLAAAPVSQPLAVDTAAALAATSFLVQTPLPAAGATFAVQLVVQNTGGATATGVSPTGDPVVIAGTASVSLATAPPPGCVTLAAGESATFAWTYVVEVQGSLQLRATVHGVDANDGATLTASADSNVATPDDAVVVADDPFGDGTSMAWITAYAGALYMGPSRDGTRIVRIEPASGVGPQPLALAIRMDTTFKSEMRNTYWLDQWAAGLPATTFGSDACAQKASPTCGPDLEDGRGTVFSGTLGGQEWLLVAGAITGGVRYLYATTSTASPLDFCWMDLRAGVVGAAKGIDSVTIVSDRLYIGYVDQSTTRPAFRAVSHPPTCPGFDAVDGTDSVDLRADKMPYLGVGGSPANAAPYVGIDSVVSFGGVLHVANNGGFMRSTVAAPRPYDTNPGDWTSATPSSGASGGAWGSRTAVQLPASIEPLPADRAVPMMAAFGGRLFAPRNVLNGGSVAAQLWGCSPGADGACDPADWSLVTPGPAADLTQLGDATNESATLAVATAAHLWVGFDNGTKGVQLFRTSTAAPAAISDFQGRGGCGAGTAGCLPIGGAGLGDPGNTRFLDAAVVTDALGRDHLYVIVGDPAAGRPLRLYDIPD